MAPSEESEIGYSSHRDQFRWRKKMANDIDLSKFKVRPKGGIEYSEYSCFAWQSATKEQYPKGLGKGQGHHIHPSYGSKSPGVSSCLQPVNGSRSNYVTQTKSVHVMPKGGAGKVGVVTPGFRSTKWEDENQFKSGSTRSSHDFASYYYNRGELNTIRGKIKNQKYKPTKLPWESL